ncbi:hypothetical protein HMPREF3226_00228 [Prevotella corporis]|uniref:Uncharacterized protein n=1 Tax=Prevotella corporis TaxID=28128 RepID=A0A133QN80_9BACT|nr:hypothetical protein HMPREF3226_00228 [Prevotella corporis]
MGWTAQQIVVAVLYQYRTRCVPNRGRIFFVSKIGHQLSFLQPKCGQ